MIQIGDPIPDLPLRYIKDFRVTRVNLKNKIKGKKVILFAVPGAFTPTCSQIHLPSFVKEADALQARGIDEIFCVAVNDPYVLDVWARVSHAIGKVTILSDGTGEFTKAMGLLLEGNTTLGLRSKRYVAVFESGILTSLQVEPDAGNCTITCAENIIKLL